MNDTGSKLFSKVSRNIDNIVSHIHKCQVKCCENIKEPATMTEGYISHLNEISSSINTGDIANEMHEIRSILTYNYRYFTENRINFLLSNVDSSRGSVIENIRNVGSIYRQWMEDNPYVFWMFGTDYETILLNPFKEIETELILAQYKYNFEYKHSFKYYMDKVSSWMHFIFHLPRRRKNEYSY